MTLLVASESPPGYHNLNLRVDDRAGPVAGLRRVFEVAVAHHRERIGQESGHDAQRLFGRIEY